jgi:hypothetical protein
MSTFVEECRREWKRLGVPDLMADEMATDLEADLAEAQADGVSAAEILGESDPPPLRLDLGGGARPRLGTASAEEPEAALDRGGDHGRALPRLRRHGGLRTPRDDVGKRLGASCAGAAHPADPRRPRPGSGRYEGMPR